MNPPNMGMIDVSDNLDDIPSSIVASVAEDALGNEVELADAVSVMIALLY
jgi:hypothetical protein